VTTTPLGNALLPAIAAAFGGFVVGAIATVYHAAWVPFGAIAAVAVIVFFLVGLRAVSRKRAPATTGALGVVAAVIILAGLDDRQSVLISANTVGLTFLASVTFVTLVILAWPRISPSATGYDEIVGRKERTPQ